MERKVCAWCAADVNKQPRKYRLSREQPHWWCLPCWTKKQRLIDEIMARLTVGDK